MQVMVGKINELNGRFCPAIHGADYRKVGQFLLWNIYGNKFPSGIYKLQKDQQTHIIPDHTNITIKLTIEYVEYSTMYFYIDYGKRVNDKKSTALFCFDKQLIAALQLGFGASEHPVSAFVFRPAPPPPSNTNSSMWKSHPECRSVS